MAVLTTIMASILALAGYQYIGTELDKQKYPPIGRMVDVGDYKLHMIDKGNGGPTVVIDPGMGGNSLSWGLVYPEIAKFSRVIVVDRAGYAWSDTSPLPRTSDNIVQELHTLLENGNIPKPYILVGHSFGGINVRLFASEYPDEVAGIILVDSSHEDQGEKLSFLPSALQPKSTMFSTWKTYLERSLGLHEYNEKVEQSIAEDIKNYPEEVRRNFIPCLLSLPFYQARQAEKLNFELSRQQLKQAAGSLGDIPLTVISRGKKATIQDYKGRWTQEQLDKYQNQVWPELQADLVTKSSRGKQIIAEKSGHMINKDQPEIIVEAVREIVEELRK